MLPGHRPSPLRPAARWAWDRVGNAGALGRVLPDFLVIGIKKGGTSSLDHYLRQHPLVLGASRKEPRFFHSQWHRGQLWYRQFFPRRAELRSVARTRGRRPLVFEATPDYLYWADVPARVARTLPGRRFVALLRDPVERAFSDYHSYVRAGREVRSFDEVVASELAVLAERGPGPAGVGSGGVGSGGAGSGEITRRAKILSMGLYADQLEAWYRHVDPGAILVLASEDLFADEVAALATITEFLGLPPHDDHRCRPANVGGHTASMGAATRARLVDLYAPHNHRLATLLGRDLRWQ